MIVILEIIITVVLYHLLYYGDFNSFFWTARVVLCSTTVVFLNSTFTTTFLLFLCFLQESTLVEVPRFKDITTDVSLNLQDRLNGVTDVLSRLSKLVCEDLEKAVSAAVGQDKDSNVPFGMWFFLELVWLMRSGLIPAVFSSWCRDGFWLSRLPSGQEANFSCGSQSSRSKPPW